MPNKVQSFTPVTHFDVEADVYVAFCEEYPEIHVVGSTEEHSHSKLFVVIEQMQKLKEYKEQKVA